jgi:hypothetical protein
MSAGARTLSLSLAAISMTRTPLEVESNILPKIIINKNVENFKKFNRVLGSQFA